MRLAAAVVLTLALTTAARAGGARVDLVVHGAAVWAVGDFGVRAVATTTGGTIYAPQPTSARYDLGVAVTGRALFVASVQNGYTMGEVTRIDLRTHSMRVVWHRAKSSAQYVMAGAGGVYVLVGSARRSSVLRMSSAGRITGRWAIVDAGRIAADASGCWVTTTHRVLHIRTSGRVVEVLTTEGLVDVATADGAAWLLDRGKLVRVDERTGVVRAMVASGTQPIGANHELAVGDGFLWTASSDGLQRRNTTTGALDRTVPLGGVVDAVAVEKGDVWAAANDVLYRLDPRTLRVTLRLALV